MPAGIGIRQVIALIRETQAIENSSEHLSVSGPGARELAAALTTGGDAGGVVVDGDPTSSAVAIRIVDGPVSPVESSVQRRIVRAGKPLIVVRHGAGAVPHALPGDVVDAGPELPLAALAATIARASPDAAPALAARLPVLRPAVERRLVTVTSWGNAVIAASPGRRTPHLPLLSVAQGRMLLLLGASRGEKLPFEPKAVAAAVGPPLTASVALGLGARELVRRLPVRGPLVRAAVAYVGTRVLAAASRRIP